LQRVVTITGLILAAILLYYHYAQLYDFDSAVGWDDEGIPT